MTRRRSAAFTRVELLAVILILGMLLALLLPAVDRSGEIRRRDDCVVRTRQIALAARYFKASEGYFPGYIMPSGTTSQNYLASWAVILAPYRERNDIWNSWTTNGGPSGPTATQVYWDQMVCPSNPPSSTIGPVCSYVVNTGRPDNSGSTPPDYAANGMCFNLYNPGSNPKAFVKNSLKDLTAGKGDTTTLFSSENILPPAYRPQLSWAPTSNPELQIGFVWQKTTTPRSGNAGDR
jgi:type II secretory pathway pseudopilin PulG